MPLGGNTTYDYGGDMGYSYVENHLHLTIFDTNVRALADSPSIDRVSKIPSLHLGRKSRAQ